ncbi:MAG: flagellar protein [Proteobacteria bacterium]|nr:flagellar protein [Pseudomonadota bacterium]
MIRVTRFDGRPMILNAEWIQSVEETPDTMITLTTGAKILVKDSVAEVVEAFENYKRKQRDLLQPSLRKAT